MPRRPVHLKGLLRYGLYVLIRLKTGTRICSGHHACVDEGDQFHLTRCHLNPEGRPGWRHLFDDKHVSDWVLWWRAYAYLGFTVARHRGNIAGVRDVGGNRSLSQLLLILGKDERFVPGGVIKPAILCRLCVKTSMGAPRCHANHDRRGWYMWLAAGTVDCPSCGRVSGGRSGVERHLGESEDCLGLWRGRVHLETFGRFVVMEEAEALMAILD
ncbi:hypothetical protein HOY82DRAFT_604386 [Tuber indicum]|nr:hypothetical protein HOY82DRAFT_604386 [Tuber indicum]